jgi:hypothetical protein
VLHKILGTISTKKKFEAHRLELAQHVWTRNCHAAESMDPHKQSTSAQLMPEAMKNGAPALIATRASRTNFLPSRPSQKNRKIDSWRLSFSVEMLGMWLLGPAGFPYGPDQVIYAWQHWGLKRRKVTGSMTR